MTTTNTNAATNDIIARHDLFMSLNYPRYDIAMVKGQGSRLWDADGKEYLDLFSGFGAGVLGHCHPDLVRAVIEQANKLWHVGNLLHTEPQTRVAEAIAKCGFGGRSFFCHSGADANEAAIKLARLFGQANPGDEGHRYKIITTTNSFHGRSFATMVATGQPKVSEGFDPLLEGFTHVPYNDFDAIKAAVDNQTIGIMVEPIQGEGGVNVPDDDYLPQLRTLCDEKNLVLIIDEVWTGVGRAGKWFAHQHWGIEPDIMTLAKGVGGGLPVGVMCAGSRVADLYDGNKHGVRHATTLGGNCLAMAVSATIFDVIERDGLLDHSNQMSDLIQARFNDLASRSKAIKDVRGKGLFLGIELNPEAGWFDSAADVVNRCMEQGVLVNAAQGTVLRIAPSLCVTKQQIEAGLKVIEDTIING